MRFLADSRPAWAIALASVALWATTAPASLGSPGSQEADPPTPDPIQQQTDAVLQPLWPLAMGELQCDASAAREIPASGETAANPSPEASSLIEGSFRLCGGPDPQVAEAIQRLIDGRSFRAKLTGRADGCADLTITVSSLSSAGAFSGRQSTLLTMPGSSGTISVEIVTENGVTRAIVGGATPPPTATPLPTATPVPPAAQAEPPSQPPAGNQGSFRLCGGSDPEAERAIEQLIQGRSFSARLVGRPDGCADLTITLSSSAPAGISTGRQSTQMNVGSGPGGAISLKIVTENGETKVTIGAGT